MNDRAPIPPADSPAMRNCDIFVIGCGPAGATAAALLAQKGWNVVVAEKDRHPRFHIGESLLPLNMPLFDALGVREAVERISVYKYGAELNSPDHDEPVMLDFAFAWDRAFPHAYQVRRSEFDQILYENCLAKGANVMQQCRVKRVDLFPGGGALVTATDAQGETGQWRARFLIDASGRDTFIANKLQIKTRNPKHASAALYGHFENARRLPGKAEGNISLFWFEHGWFWFIPLRDGTTSVGAVCWPYYLRQRKTDPTAFFLDTIKLCPPLAARLKDARLTEPATATGNYSYLSRSMTGPSHILLGDAFAFIDPVFSSGVFLAMNSAFLGAEAVDTALRHPERAAAALRAFERSISHGLRHFSWFIYRMTSPAMRKLFMAPRNLLRMQEALMSLLAGDLYRGTPIYGSLRAFKVLYYVTSVIYLRDCVAAWRRRRRMIAGEAREAAAAG